MGISGYSIITTALASLVTALGATHVLAEGHATRGERAFGKCVACHNIDSPRTRLGPHLMGIAGRPAGAVVDFSGYSQALKDAAAAGLIWNDAELAEFLSSPKKFIPGTSMRFFGLWSQQEIEDIIAYLKTKPLPEAK